MELKEAKSEKEYQIAVALFKEYASQIGVDLAFQNFNQEIENIESQYSRPNGVIIIAFKDEKIPLGCFGIRKLEDAICELKRMYLIKDARGMGLGKKLLSKSIGMANELGYKKMKLDTLPTMLSAIKLYEQSGFYEIDPYRFNPIEGTKYFEIKLNN